MDGGVGRLSGFPKKRAPKSDKFTLTPEQKEEITEAFRLFDTEKQGSIDYHELKVAMRALGCDVRKAEVKALIEDYSKDGSERVDFDAFSSIMTAKYAARDPEAEMRKAFALFDEDGSGKISLKNLKRVARELGEAIPEEELEAMIDEVRWPHILASCVCVCKRRSALSAHSQTYKVPSPPHIPFTTFSCFPSFPPLGALQFDSTGEGAVTEEDFLSIMRSAL